ncbi:MAG: hypothetical protein M2R45_00118 [Verrucomicrobia subdivision 3 bacterium]|nr:hypothetical protein [Limisphaerales bacterium]MCS1412422.1 hypothetical protein [Limisphaerales bacterium]
MLLFRPNGEGLEGILDRLRKIERAGFEIEFTRFDFRKVENIIDDLEKGVALRSCQLEIFSLFIVKDDISTLRRTKANLVTAIQSFRRAVSGCKPWRFTTRRNRSFCCIRTRKTGGPRLAPRVERKAPIDAITGVSEYGGAHTAYDLLVFPEDWTPTRLISSYGNNNWIYNTKGDIQRRRKEAHWGSFEVGGHPPTEIPPFLDSM